MSTSTLHPLATAYLQQVRREGRDLPGDRLAELLADLEEHLSAAIPADASDQDAREVLDRLGDPREIVAAERPESIAPAERRGTREWVAIFLLLFGFVAAGVGWVVGVVLLWRSRAWTTRDKLIGTLVLPGGLVATGLLLLLALGRPHKEICTHRATSATHYVTSVVTHCTSLPGSGPSTLVSVALVLLALTPIATAVYLARRAR
jgi:HAAS domain-containing protein